MLEKTFYKQLLKRSFAMPVKIVFWDGSSVQYGQGEPKATITFREKVPVSAVTKNASIALGEAYMDQKIDITGPGTYPLQEVITSAYQQAGSFLRNAKLFKQYCRQNYFHIDECNFSSQGRSNSSICIRYSDVCRRTYSTSSLWHV